MKKYLLFLAVPALLFGACKKGNGEPKNPPTSREVATVNELQNALKDGVSTIKLTTPLTADAEIDIPKTYGEGAEIALTIPAAGKNVTIAQATTGNAQLPSTIDLNISGAKDLTINAPAMTVELLNGTTVTGVLSSTTADETLIVNTGVSIADLKVLKGNVLVKNGATLTKVTSVATTSKIMYEVGTLEQLNAVIAMAKDGWYGAKLTGDITVQSTAQHAIVIGDIATWTEPTKFYQASAWDGFVLDGDNKTISGYSAKGNLLLVIAKNVTVKNLRLTQVAADKANADRVSNGMTVYCMEDVKIENVEFTNLGKAGLIVAGATIEAKNLKFSENEWGGINLGKGAQYREQKRAPKLKITEGDLADIKDLSKVWVDLNETGTVENTDWSFTYPSTGWTGLKKYSYTPSNQIIWATEVPKTGAEPM